MKNEFVFEPRVETVLLVDCDGRTGEAERLCQGFAAIGLRTQVLSNVVADVIVNAVAEFAHRSSDIFICVILAAGSSKAIRTRSGFLSREAILKAGNRPNLYQKPKIFVFDGRIVSQTESAALSWNPVNEMLRVENTISCEAFTPDCEAESSFINAFVERIELHVDICQLFEVAERISRDTHVVRVHINTFDIDVVLNQRTSVDGLGRNVTFNLEESFFCFSAKMEHPFVFEPKEETVLIIDCDGRDKDISRIATGVTALGFKTKVLSKIAANNILRSVTDSASQSQNIFLCFILAAGSASRIRAIDGFLCRETIAHAANVPTLYLKPKLLFFDGMEVEETNRANITWSPLFELLFAETTILCKAYAYEEEPESSFLKVLIENMLKNMEISDLIRDSQRRTMGTHNVHVHFKCVGEDIYLNQGKRTEASAKENEFS